MLLEDRASLWRARISFLLSNNYLYLLLTLSAVLVLWPMLQRLTVWTGVLEGLLFLTLWFSIFAASRKPRQRAIALVLATIGVTIRLGWGLFDLQDAYMDLMYALFFFYAATLMVTHIFTASEKVNVNMIYGAVSVYMLIGLAFAFVYAGLAGLDPESFSGLDQGPGARDLFLQIIYFSFVTLSTLGYGDILPVSDLARPLAYAEAIAGQLYLTVLVARLVGMHISERIRS
ncbi:MAG: potassium channel family protein [Gammaproteobacteria bacterium]|nr:potassium channel family protein [Gammaproteobacteria bacterium]